MSCVTRHITIQPSHELHIGLDSTKPSDYNSKLWLYDTSRDFKYVTRHVTSDK